MRSRILHPGPPMYAELDWSSQAWRKHPQARGLELYVPHAGIRDIAGGVEPTKYNAPGQSNLSGWGPARTFSTNQYLSYPTRSFASTDSFSIMCVFKLNATEIGDALISSAGTANWFLQIGGGARPLQFMAAVVGQYQNLGSAQAATTGRTYSIFGTYEYPNRWRIYVDGLEAGYDLDYSHDAVSAWSGVDIGRRGDGYYSNSVVTSYALWSRVISPTEISQLYAPQTRWDMLSVRSTKRYFIAAAASTIYQRRRPGIFRVGSRSIS